MNGIFTFIDRTGNSCRIFRVSTAWDGCIWVAFCDIDDGISVRTGEFFFSNEAGRSEVVLLHGSMS